MLKGQVSLEAVIAVTLLMLTLIVVLSQDVGRKEQLDFFSTTEIQKNNCNRILSSITLVDATGNNSRIELEIGFDAKVIGNFIEFENYLCEYHGQLTDSSLVKGNIRIEKINEVITIENI